MNSIERQVLQIIGENADAPDVFTDDDDGIRPIRDSVNAAIQEICMVTGSYTTSYFLPLYEGRHFYRLGWSFDYFGWVIECWDRTRRRRLEQTDIVTLGQTDPDFLKSSGDPDLYMQIGYEYIGFDRAPSASGKVLELKCVAIPKAYDTDDAPVKVRPQYQRALVQYACSEFFAGRGDAVRAKEWMERYVATAGLSVINPQQPERIMVIGANQGSGGGS